MPRTWRWAAVGGAALLALGLTTALLTPATGRTSLDPAAATPGGTRALAELLGDQGVSVERTTDRDRALSTGPATTLVVAYPALLAPEDLRAIEELTADVILLGPPVGVGDYLGVAPGRSVPVIDRAPQCPLEAAVASGDARTGGVAFDVPGSSAESSASTTGCFDDDGLPTLVQRTTTRGSHHIVLGSADFMTNEWIDDAGNAALAMNLAGQNPVLVWWLPTPQYAGQQSLTSLLPDGVWPLLALLFLVVLAVAAWRARRLGPLAVEPLPVVVRAAETTEGRARIYQRHRTRDQAALHLRIETAELLRLRLGLPPTSEPDAVVAAVAAATGRRPDQVHAILYGPPPDADGPLVSLGQQLAALEQEVRRA
jgi:hypothetical protein